MMCMYFLGYSSKVYMPQWLNALRRYSGDLDWSIDNINDQHEMNLDNIFTRMKENWKYRGLKREPRVLRYEIFKSNMGQLLKNKRAQMKMRNLECMEKPKTIRLDHWMNMVENTRDPKNIKETNFMRKAKKCVRKVSTFRWSEGEVWIRLVCCYFSFASMNLSLIVHIIVHGVTLLHLVVHYYAKLYVPINL